MSNFLSGKVVLGMIVVTAATGGFTLGYFVGKSISCPTAPAAARQPMNEGEMAAVAGSRPHQGIDSALRGVTAGQVPSVDNKESEIPSPIPDKSPLNVAVREEGKSSLSKARTQPAEDAKGSSGEKVLLGQASVPRNARPRSDAVAKSSPSESGREASATTASSARKVVYTVQAGAFRNQNDAEALKRKLEAKGYRVSLRKESNANGVVFFKVRTGDFDKKKEASVFALTLKKTDGLNAFATEKK